MGGKAYYEAHKHDYPSCKLIPGKHYRVVEGCRDYRVFPDHPALSVFRHRWVLVRTPRPMVPVFQHSKLPRAGLSAEENARLCSVYLRPWTLCADFAAPPHVPHLLQLAMYPLAEPEVARPAARRRVTGKRSPPVSSAPDARPTWATSWGRYIRGNVVSDHAARLITNFLTATMARADAGGDSTDEEADAADDDDAAPPLCPTLDEVREVLQAAPENDDVKLSRSQQQHARTIRRGRDMWTLQPSGRSDGATDTAGAVPNVRVGEYGKAARAAGKELAAKVMPFAGQTAPVAVVHERGSMADIHRWLEHLQSDRFASPLVSPFSARAVRRVLLNLAAPG